jgi:hypothetical protein
MSMPIAVRLPADLLAEIDALARDMESDGRPEVAMSGDRWGRSALIRLLLATGAPAYRLACGVPKPPGGTDGR